MIRRSSDKASAVSAPSARAWNLNWLITALGSSCAVLYGFDLPPSEPVAGPGHVDWDAELTRLLADD